MASHTINGQAWPSGTVVSVYKGESQPAGQDTTPAGVAVTTATVSGASVTFTGLTEGRRYVAYAAGVSKRFLVQPGSVDTLRPITGSEAAQLRDDLDGVAGDVSSLEGRNLTGTGSPEGVVTASPGATFQQTNGVEGATHWIKETGVGSTGWRLVRRLFPYDINLFGPESRAAEAMQAGTSTTYAFPSSALSSSTSQLLSGLNARIRAAYWNLIWTPSAVGCGVELVSADAGPTNIVQMAEFTGSASASPLNNTVNVTTAMQALVAITEAGVPTGVNNKTVGYRTKGDGVVGPLIYVSRVHVLFEA